MVHEINIRTVLDVSRPIQCDLGCVNGELDPSAGFGMYGSDTDTSNSRESTMDRRTPTLNGAANVQICIFPTRRDE